jgi:hypothetical protein
MRNALLQAPALLSYNPSTFTIESPETFVITHKLDQTERKIIKKEKYYTSWTKERKTLQLET